MRWKVRAKPGRRHSRSTVSTSSQSEVYSGSKPRRSAGPSSTQTTERVINKLKQLWRPEFWQKHVSKVLTLSKKQRPTSSGQSVYASRSFRNVLDTNTSQVKMCIQSQVTRIILTYKNCLKKQTSCETGRFQTCCQTGRLSCWAECRGWGEPWRGCPSLLHSPEDYTASQEMSKMIYFPWSKAVLSRISKTRLQHTQQLLHVGSLRLQQFVHHVTETNKHTNQKLLDV